MKKTKPSQLGITQAEETRHDLNNNILFFENRISNEWFSTEQAAKFLCLSPNALRICVCRGQIKAYRFRRRLRFRVEDLRQALLKGGA